MTVIPHKRRSCQTATFVLLRLPAQQSRSLSLGEAYYFAIVRKQALTGDPGPGSGRMYTKSFNHDREDGRCGFSASHLQGAKTCFETREEQMQCSHGFVWRCPNQSSIQGAMAVKRPQDCKVGALKTRAGRAGAVQQEGRGCLTSHVPPGQSGPGGQAREPPSELPKTCRSIALPGAGPATIPTLLQCCLARLQMLPLSSSLASSLPDLRIVVRRPFNKLVWRC